MATASPFRPDGHSATTGPAKVAGSPAGSARRSVTSKICTASGSPASPGRVARTWSPLPQPLSTAAISLPHPLTTLTSRWVASYTRVAQQRPPGGDGERLRQLPVAIERNGARIEHDEKRVHQRSVENGLVLLPEQFLLDDDGS